MRPILTATTAQMTPPASEDRARASAGGTMADHDAWMAAWPAMQTLELSQPPIDLPVPDQITVAAWNIERCKRVEDSAGLLRRAGADVVLATEMDWGMARSGQRHTPRDLARALGFGYVFGVEFVELGTGDPYETSLFDGQPNAHGLHGNAILSRYPLRNGALIPLDSGGDWYAASPKGDGQYRVGGRMAMAAQIDAPNGPVTFAAVHFESESTPASRGAQMRTLTDGIDRHFGPGPCVIGGDLNTNAMRAMTAGERLANAARVEPCFAVAQAAGFGWQNINTGGPTTRAAPGKMPHYPLDPLDWLFTRNIPGSTPQVWPALSAHGDYLSDHELITALLTL